MKVQIPLLHKAAGRCDGLIYQSYYGNTYTRSMPILFHYPDTKKQQDCQATFFDIQRIWVPIYNVLTTSIKRQQRKNKNPFNVMSGFIYKIFHPYSVQDAENYPSNFGLDRLNRVRPVVIDTVLSIRTKIVHLSYDMQRFYNDTGLRLTTTNLLLFNITRQSMYFQQIALKAGQQQIDFMNTNDWENGDMIVIYMALSCENWLGNFNRVAI